MYNFSTILLAMDVDLCLHTKFLKVLRTSKFKIDCHLLFLESFLSQVANLIM